MNEEVDLYSGWARSVVVAIDQLGNALAGGHPDVTISARVGYFAAQGKRYFGVLENVIDWAFRPVDGDGHCAQARAGETGEQFQRGNDVALGALTLITLPTCLVLRPILWLASKA